MDEFSQKVQKMIFPEFQTQISPEQPATLFQSRFQSTSRKAREKLIKRQILCVASSTVNLGGGICQQMHSCMNRLDV